MERDAVVENVTVNRLRCEYRVNPLGLDVRKPRFSWQLNSARRGTLQHAYRIVVAGREDGFDAPLWDSDVQVSEQSIQVEYDGPELSARTRYYYRVKAWTQDGAESEWSDTAWWETGLLYGADAWQAKWVTPHSGDIDPDSEPSFLLRKGFELAKEVASARVYASAAGVYELYVNGRLASEDVLAPGWTSYPVRIQYQTYDVTELLRQGGNGIGIMLGDGWYKSGMGFEGKNFKYGERRAAVLQLHVRYADGTEDVIVTDESWQAGLGPVRYATIYHGEVYDARLELPDWSGPVAAGSWKRVQACELPLDVLTAQENDPTRVTGTLKPVAYFVTPAGDHVLDMGQNMVGRVRFTVEAPEGTRIVLRHAEVLDKDGNIYFGNLRPARQTVEYVAKGGGGESYAPHFTFMGFRYVKVEGYPGLEDGGTGLPLDAFAGEVLHTDMASTGEFECSDPRINQLQSNIRWGQRGNFLDVPTDCPQRDERLGWTGDAQVFISTALYNFQGAPFFTKWLRDLKAEQLPDGGVPFVIPDVVGGASSSAWGDAAVICPWTVYQYYGDTRLLAEQYESMKRWVEYIRAQGDNEFMWNTGFHFGDWLALDAKENSYKGATPDSLVATAYYAYSTRIVRDAAEALGLADDAAKYGELYRGIVQAFRDEFVTAKGRIAYPSQTAHVLALVFDLVDDSVRGRVAKDLNDLIVDNDYHLSTGFVGTPYLCFALSNNGYHETAVKLLAQESYPGWLYSVSKGATTIWEHWDSIKPDGSFWSDDMNSFNHYAYGAIGDWMYRKVAGLDTDRTVPAFKRLHIEPLFGLDRLTFARTAHESMYGRVESGWRVQNGRVEVSVTVPANATAEVVLKGARLSGLRESGRELVSAAAVAAAESASASAGANRTDASGTASAVAASGTTSAVAAAFAASGIASSAEGVHAVAETSNGVTLSIGSGTYVFTYDNADLFKVKFSGHTRVSEVLGNAAGAELLKRHLPHLVNSPMINFVQKSSLYGLAENTMTGISREQIEALLADLKEI
ncbi:family 78 glycoside hydrolase catalytic domain [Paenibacillus chartarius]|uniref:alpha-L-rhamnosidase n=1 Tax=Paenibacillus chartarius TaxID=747481 RepID=A0ABV6DRA1_9BACL